MKRKFKLIVPSFLTLIFCLLLIAGSTFAIFSSQDEASIEVTSGKVHVTATLTNLAAFSAEADDSVTNESDNWAGEVTSGLGAGKYKYVEATPVANSETPKFEFATKGTAELTNDKTLILNNIVPGDKVTLKLTLTNSSNVDVKYRVRLNAIEDNGLLDGLEVKVNGTELVGTIKNTAWLPLAADGTISDMPLEVLLPITAGNEYQEKTAKLRFTVEMVQANAKVDEVLDLVNGYLTSLGNTNKTMWDAIQDANAWLALPENAGKSFTATNYVWNMDTDQFYAEDNVVAGQGFESRFFKAYTYAQYQLGHSYAVYALGTDWPSSLTINHSFDQGSVNMSSIKYDRHDATEGQEAVVRTNSASTDLEIDAPKDVVHHYGTAGTLTITAVAGQSYHEFGKAAFVEIKNGRIVLEQEAKVEQIHLVATEGVFNDITVAKDEQTAMPDFSRDPVEIPEEGKLVVALQSSTNVDAEKDYVWLTAVGIYEQVTVSDSNTEAGNNYAAEITSTEQKATEQKTAAQQISNNITFEADGEDYKVTAKTTDGGATWTYEVVDKNGDVSEDYSAEKDAEINTVNVQTTSETPEAVTTTTENGLSEAAKEEKQTELVNEAIIPELADQYEDETTAVVYNMNTKVYYEDLYTAINEVSENTKTTLVLLKNISGTSNKNYVIPASKNIVLDLNGKVLNTVAPDESTAYTIENKGILVIKDATDKAKNGSGTGKITSSAVKPDMQDVPGYASNTITNLGNLTVESGIIENRGAGFACFAIDNQTNGNSYTPVLTINGGKMLQESQYHYAVRMFCNSVTKDNKVIVNGGIISGGYGLWLQIPNSNADKAELIINGGTIQAKDGYSLFVGGSGATNDTRNYTETTIIINGGNIDSMGLSGVSDSARTLKMFEINGGNIGGLAYGANINPVIASNVVIPE